MWSLAFYKTHRNMVRCEDFDRYVEEWHTFRANTQAEMAELRKDFSDEMREMNKNVVALVREMKADLSTQMERSYEVLDGKAEKIDKSYHAFKDSLQGFQLYYNRKMLGLKGDE
jgi:Skp family chaperone for outer membrane proteins